VLGGEVVIKCQTKHTTYTVGTIPECCVLGEVVINVKQNIPHALWEQFLHVACLEEK
jgi:hypothetical protein